MIVAVDFDGTCVTHRFPKIGKDIGAVPVLKRLVKNGHKLILFTMRGDRTKVSTTPPDIVPIRESKSTLSEAVQWFVKNGITLFGINCNPDQFSWTDSPKPYAHIYIDDAGLGIPLKSEYGERPYVDWEKVEVILEKLGFFQRESL